MIFKLRRRQSSSLPLRTSHPPTSYVHHASTPPDWPTTPMQATPDVYITSPAEDDGLQTSVCVHRAIEHEPKKLRKNDEHRMSAPASTTDSSGFEGDLGPPVFRRSSLPAPDVVMPKKLTEVGSTKWTQILNRQSATDKGAQERVEQDAVVSGVELFAAGQVQWEGGHQLTRVSSSRDVPDEPAPTPAMPKPKHTLRHRASKVFKTFKNRESLAFGSSSAEKIENRANGSQQKRRNTLSDGSRPFGIWMRTATAHAIPTATVDDSVVTSPKTSVEGRRRSSTIARVEGIARSTTPPLPPQPVPQEIAAKGLPTVPAVKPAANEAILPLEPPLEIAEPASRLTSDTPKSRKLQNKRSKGTFSHLFNLKGGEKQFRSPPPAKQEDAPVPPVPVIPQELAKAVADPGTPEVVQTSTFAPPAATPKSTKSKRFLRRRRATIGSISQLPNGTPSSLATPDTPKTPTSLHSRPFSIIDLRKGFSMRSLGKNKGKLMSAKPSPVTPPPVPKLSKEEEREPPATVMQRYKMSRPPPLQPSDPPRQSETAPVPTTASTLVVSPTTTDFNKVAEAIETALSSPAESEGPVTPTSGTEPGSAPALAPAIELGEPKQSEEAAPELSFTPPTSEESEQSTHRPSAASEATLAVEDPLFDALDRPSSIGDLHLRLHEPATKTSTFDAHLRLDSLRFDHFSFDADVF